MSVFMFQRQRHLAVMPPGAEAHGPVRGARVLIHRHSRRWGHCQRESWCLVAGHMASASLTDSFVRIRKNFHSSFIPRHPVRCLLSASILPSAVDVGEIKNKQTGTASLLPGWGVGQRVAGGSDDRYESPSGRESVTWAPETMGLEWAGGGLQAGEPPGRQDPQEKRGLYYSGQWGGQDHHSVGQENSTRNSHMENKEGNVS